jgi:hypothetical protein
LIVPAYGQAGAAAGFGRRQAGRGEFFNLPIEVEAEFLVELLFDSPAVE